MKILIKNGRMINPSDKTDETGDLFIEDGVIKRVGADSEVAAFAPEEQLE